MIIVLNLPGTWINNFLVNARHSRHPSGPTLIGFLCVAACGNIRQGAQNVVDVAIQATRVVAHILINARVFSVDKALSRSTIATGLQQFYCGKEIKF